MQSAKNILIAPLDWGLGHTSRCMPIIEYLLHEKQNVFFAGNDIQIAIIKNKYPKVSTIFLNGYNVTYGSSKATFMPKMLMQLPKLRRAILNENIWIQKLQESYQFDIIISDNRYGVYHKDCFNIFLTHQMQPQTGSTIGNYFVSAYLQKFTKHFQEIWIVDTIDTKLAGKLSEAKMHTKHHYIGWLSQFQNIDNDSSREYTSNNYILAILSGPEPARSQLSNLLLTQMHDITDHNFIVVGGLPNSEIIKTPKHIRYIPFADSVTLQALMLQASLIISRSGYSTIMDLIALKKDAILIPTPGQTEQMYLGKYLRNKKQFICIQQKDFNLKDCLQEKFNFKNTLKFESFLQDSLHKILNK